MLQIAGRLKLFWRVRGHLDEGRRRLESALAHVSSEATSGRESARGSRSTCAAPRRVRRGEGVLAVGLEIWRALGDEEGVARALGDLASVYDLVGDAERAIPL